MVLETAAFGEDGAEDAAHAGGIERPGIALDKRVEDGGFARFVRNRQSMLLLEAGDLRYGLGAAVDEAEEFEVELVNGSALLSQGRIHGSLLWQKHKGRDWKIAAGVESVCEV